MQRPIVGHVRPTSPAIEQRIYGLVQQANEQQHPVSVAVLETHPSLAASLELLLANSNSRQGRDMVFYQGEKTFVLLGCDQEYAAQLLEQVRNECDSVAAYVQEYVPRPPATQPLQEARSMMRRMKEMLAGKPLRPSVLPGLPVWKLDAQNFSQDLLAGFAQVLARKQIYFPHDAGVSLHAE